MKGSSRLAIVLLAALAITSIDADTDAQEISAIASECKKNTDNQNDPSCVNPDPEVTEALTSSESESSSGENSSADSESNSSDEIEEEPENGDSDESNSSATETVPVSSEGADSDEVESEAESVPIGSIEKCPVDDDGESMFTPHESDCGLFYTCIEGKKVVLACLEGLAFNPESKVCDRPENAGCTSGNVDDTDSSDSDATDSPDSIEAEGSNTESSESSSADNSNTTESEASSSENNSEDSEPNSSDEVEDESSNSDNTESTPESTESAPVSSEGSGSDDAESEPESVPIGSTGGCPVNDEGHGILKPHESDCGLFYTCAGGKIVVLACPEGLAFNPNSTVCDWPENVGCTPGSVNDTNSSDIDVTISPDSIEIEGSNTESSESSSADNSSTTESEASSSENNSEDSEPNSSDEVEDESSNGDNTESTPESTEAAPVSSEGSGSDEAESEPESVPIGSTGSCPVNDEGHGILKPHESDCSLFYTCAGGKIVVLACPEGLAFNPDLSVCDWPENAGCTSGSESNSSDEVEDESSNGDNTESTPESTEAAPVSSEGSGSDDAESGPESVPIGSTGSCPVNDEGHGILKPHESDCSLFYTCAGGKIVVLACPEGLAFNPDLSVCDWPENAGCTLGSVNHTNSSNTDVTDSPDSIEIEESTTESSASTNSPETDSSTEKSSDSSNDEIYPTEASPDNSENSDPHTTETQAEIPTECPANNGDATVHIAHESNCAEFYICNHGNKVQMKCPAGLHFNAFSQVCDWPASAGCTLGTAEDSGDEIDSAEDSTDKIDPVEDESDNSEDSEPDTTEAHAPIPTVCPANNEGGTVHISHESDCNKFYTCNHGNPIEMRCSAGLHFNTALQVCDWPVSAGCTLRSNSDGARRR